MTYYFMVGELRPRAAFSWCARDLWGD